MKHIFYSNSYLFYGTLAEVQSYVFNPNHFSNPLSIWGKLSFIRLSDVKPGFDNIIVSLKILNLLNYGNTPLNSQSDIIYLKNFFSEPLLEAHLSANASTEIH